MKIYRIDGNRCFHEAIKGLSYHLTKELAKKRLINQGYYLEKRKWEGIGGHLPNTEDKFWYDKKLDENGYCYDRTNYAYIIEINVYENEEILKSDSLSVPFSDMACGALLNR